MKSFTFLFCLLFGFKAFSQKEITREFISASGLVVNIDLYKSLNQSDKSILGLSFDKSNIRKISTDSLNIEFYYQISFQEKESKERKKIITPIKADFTEFGYKIDYQTVSLDYFLTKVPFHENKSQLIFQITQVESDITKKVIIAKSEDFVINIP